MTTSLALLTALLVLAALSLQLHLQAQRHTRLRIAGRRGWTVELRRQARICSLPGDLQPYPLPREFRLLVWRLAGLPVWRREALVCLPLQCDAQIDRIDAQGFDHLFDDAFRLQPPRAGRPAAQLTM